MILHNTSRCIGGLMIVVKLLIPLFTLVLKKKQDMNIIKKVGEGTTWHQFISSKLFESTF